VESVPAPLLAYDDLPPGSDLCREFTANGVTITAACEAPSSRAIRWARRRAVPPAARDTTALLALLGLWIWLMAPPQPIRSLAPAVYPLLGLLAGSIFLLAWQGRSAQSIDALRIARRQATLIAADAQMLRIESEGPFGAQSHSLAATSIRGLNVQQQDRPWFTMDRRVLRVTLEDGRCIDLLAGRDDSELAWATSVLRQAIGIAEAHTAR
jgi:hypothetical protein